MAPTMITVVLYSGLLHVLCNVIVCACISKFKGKTVNEIFAFNYSKISRDTMKAYFLSILKSSMTALYVKYIFINRS
jgi:hypothetical protein